MMRLADETPDEVGGLVDIENIERLWEARADEKGVLLCTVHVGGMDVIAPALKMHGQALHVIADDTTYGRLYDHLKAVRARHGLTLIGCNLRGLFKALRAGENLVLFCDGGYRPGDVPVEFLGEPTPPSRPGRPRCLRAPAHRCCRSPATAPPAIASRRAACR